MARFVFKLDPLLEARRRAERSAQRRVAEIERERLALEDRIRRMQQAIASGKQAMKGRLTGVLHMENLRGHAGSTLRLMRDAQRFVLELAGVHKRLEKARGELREAMRRRRAIELLRERRHEEWRRALDKAESAALDELAVVAAARREVEP